MSNWLANPRDLTNPDSPRSTVGLFVESSSLSMRQVEPVIREVAQSEVPVSLLGERGVGKRDTAQRIHELSRRKGQAFLELNCSDLSAEHLARVHDQREALVGTIYLKDAAKLSPACQLYLRDALLKYSEAGSTNSRSTRFICGSAVELEAEVKARRLREDLYYGISGVCLRLPPVRQRKEDIPVLMEHFLEKYAQEYRRPVPALSAETRRLFREYSWPGNLRELEDATRALVAIGDEHLAMGGLRSLLQRKRPAERNNKSVAVSLKAASRAASHEAERELILDALTRTRWNRRRAAQELQISYKALLYKLKQIGCEGYEAR